MQIAHCKQNKGCGQSIQLRPKHLMRIEDILVFIDAVLENKNILLKVEFKQDELKSKLKLKEVKKELLEKLKD